MYISRFAVLELALYNFGQTVCRLFFLITVDVRASVLQLCCSCADRLSGNCLIE